jgi:hypothetical protein
MPVKGISLHFDLKAAGNLPQVPATCGVETI